MAVPLSERRPKRERPAQSGHGENVAIPHASASRPLRPDARISEASAKAAQSTNVRHNWPLYAFLFFLPLQNLQTYYMPNLGGGLNFLNIGFGLSLIGAWYCGGRITDWSGVHRWIILYVAWSLVALWIGFANVPADSSNRFNVLKDSMLGVMIVFLVQMSVTDWTTLKRVILFMILPLPYTLRVTWSEHQSVSSWHYNDALRISGTFSELGANEFSSFCVTMTLMLFALLLAGKLSKAWRAVLIGGVTCMVLGILWTYSRTAYVTVLAGALSILLLWRGRWKMVVPLVLIGTLAPPLLPHAVTERFDSTHVEAADADESTELRYEYWNVAWDIFAQHPITGAGDQTFYHLNPYKKDTHNIYMRTLAEKGLIGIVVLVGLLISILRACLRTMREAPSGGLGYALGLGMIGAWLALVIGNFWGDRFTYAQMIGYFWAFVGLTLKARELTMAERTNTQVIQPAAASEMVDV